MTSAEAAGATLERPHVWRPGPGRPPLLLLHGTGADEHDLLPLAGRLGPDSPLLSPRGTVNEGGALRFFRRHAEGVFDEDDLRVRTAELASFVEAAGAAHGIAAGSWVAVGFSNGANIATSLLLARPDLLAGVVLLGAMVPFAEPPAADLHGRWAVVSNGQRDPLAPPAVTATLVGQLRERGADVLLADHPLGHTVDPRVLPGIAAVIAERTPG